MTILSWSKNCKSITSPSWFISHLSSGSSTNKCSDSVLSVPYASQRHTLFCSASQEPVAILSGGCSAEAGSGRHRMRLIFRDTKRPYMTACSADFRDDAGLFREGSPPPVPVSGCSRHGYRAEYLPENVPPCSISLLS